MGLLILLNYMYIISEYEFNFNQVLKHEGKQKFKMNVHFPSPTLSGITFSMLSLEMKLFKLKVFFSIYLSDLRTSKFLLK